jgi:mRNA-degrading endonuclease RelE of RelBE toxin-antitoxin system
MTPHFYRLEGIGGDNDGDQVSLYMLMSDESIEEANNLLFDIKYYIKPDGTLMNNPSIPPADLLMKHLTTTLDTNTIIMQANDLIGVFTKEELIKKLNKISNNNFTTLNNNIYVLLNDKMDVLSYVEYVYLNRNIDNGTDYSYFTETYGKRVRSDGYVVINSFSSDKKTIELFYKILEDDFNGYDSVLEISNLNKEQIEMLTLLNYKKQDKIYIRYAI